MQTYSWTRLVRMRLVSRTEESLLLEFYGERVCDRRNSGLVRQFYFELQRKKWLIFTSQLRRTIAQKSAFTPWKELLVWNKSSNGQSQSSGQSLLTENGTVLVLQMSGMSAMNGWGVPILHDHSSKQGFLL